MADGILGVFPSNWFPSSLSYCFLYPQLPITFSHSGFLAVLKHGFLHCLQSNLILACESSFSQLMSRFFKRFNLQQLKLDRSRRRFNLSMIRKFNLHGLSLSQLKRDRCRFDRFKFILHNLNIFHTNQFNPGRFNPLRADTKGLVLKVLPRQFHS